MRDNLNRIRPLGVYPYRCNCKEKVMLFKILSGKCQLKGYTLIMAEKAIIEGICEDPDFIGSPKCK